MGYENTDKDVYRFAAFAARGTITFQSDRVHIRMRTHLGWWEQSMALNDLKPNFGTLSTTPQIFLWVCILPLILTWMGVYGVIWGIPAIPQRVLSVSLVIAGVALTWNLVRNRKTDWIIFTTIRDGGHVCYTRQGPDTVDCDQFTERLVHAISLARQEQSKNKD